MKDKIILAIIPIIATIIVGILLPERSKLFLFNFIVHYFVRYVSNWQAIIGLLLLASGAFLILSHAFSSYLKIVAFVFVLALVIFLPIITMKTYWKFRGLPSSFTIGVSNFLVANENGRLSNSKQGVALKQFIFNSMTELNERENNTFTKIVKPNIIEINPTEFEISNESALSFNSLLKDNFFSTRAHIIIWGILSENGEVDKIFISYKEGLFKDKGVLRLQASDYFKKFDTFIVKLCKNKPPSEKAQILANLFYALVSQAPSISTASQYDDIFAGLKLLDESYKLWNKTISRYAADLSDVKDITSYFDLVYDLNRVALFHNAGRRDAEIEAIFKILDKNPFFPMSTYEDFKTAYDLYYTSSIATKSLEYAKDDDTISAEEKIKLSFKNNLYKYEGPYFLIDRFTDLIVNNDNYDSNLRYYETLAKHHPHEPLVYLFWGDAIKLYKSESCQLNLDRVDPAIAKYKIAEKLDPAWPLIGSKIFFVSLLQLIQEEELGHIKKVETIKLTLESYKEKQKKYFGTLEVEKFLSEDMRTTLSGRSKIK